MRPKNKLNALRPLFLLTGLILALTFVLSVMSYKTYYEPIALSGDTPRNIDEVIEIVTIQRTVPQKPQKSDIIRIDPDPSPEPDPDPLPEPDPDPKPNLNTGISLDSLAQVGSEPDLEPDVSIHIATVQHKPIFPGCEGLKTEEERFQCFNEKLILFVQQHVEYPRAQKEMGIQGKPIISFQIDKNGNVTDFSVARSADPALDKAAVKALSGLPKMEPAKNNGLPVKVIYSVPITFKLR
jgi:periplasmic protein TonB